MKFSEFKKNPAVPVGVAAIFLGVTPKRIYQLVSENKLTSCHYFGGVWISVSSIETRQHLQELRRKKSPTL